MLYTLGVQVEINSTKEGGIPEALEAARKADVVVLALGDDKSIEREGHDRTDTALPGLQESFAQKVLALNKPTILAPGLLLRILFSITTVCRYSTYDGNLNMAS